MKPIDADVLAEGLELHYQYTDQEYDSDRQWAIGYNAGLDRALYTIAHARTVTTAPSQPVAVGGWISVEDRLPEQGKEVLLLAHGWEGRLHYIGKLEPSPAQEGFFRKSKASDWTIWGWSYFREPKVTHWMPLPEPPENDCPGVCGCTGNPSSECQPGPCGNRRSKEVREDV